MNLPTTACQHALSMPEIVGEIVAWINEDKHLYIRIPKPGVKTWDELMDEIDPKGVTSMEDLPRPETPYYSCGRQGVLFRCALVNKLWFSESVRFLWGDLLYIPHWMSALPYCFLGPTPPRRQFYANFVKQASLSTFDKPRPGFYYNTTQIDDVIFPNLERLLLGCESCPEPGISFAPIQCPNLKVLEIDPKFENGPPSPIYGVFQDDWDCLFDQIANLWPSLETIKIIDCARVWPGALKRYEKLMPCLKTFDTTRVIEDSWPGM